MSDNDKEQQKLLPLQQKLLNRDQELEQLKILLAETLEDNIQKQITIDKLLGKTTQFEIDNFQLQDALDNSAASNQGLEQEVSDLRDIAYTDNLTGLPNINYFNIHAAALLSNLRNTSVSLLFFDIDKFKFVNDTYGHDVGDSILKQLADIARQHVNQRSGEQLMRLHGDEFVLMLNDTNAEQAAIVARRWQQAISMNPFDLGIEPKQTLGLLVSIGIATAGEGDTVESLKKRADEAMYADKQQRKNS